jgi:hypothetical protein
MLWFGDEYLRRDAHLPCIAREPRISRLAQLRPDGGSADRRDRAALAKIRVGC